MLKIAKIILSLALIILIMTEHLLFSVFAVEKNVEKDLEKKVNIKQNILTKSLNILENKIIKNKVKAFTKGKVTASFSTWTIIKSKTKDEKLDFSNIKFSEIKEKEKKVIEKKLKEKNIKMFNFWISTKNLIFSKPVKITIPVDYKDKVNLEILAKDNGNKDFYNSSLSIDSNIMCKKWISSISDKNTISSVKNGKITFYTCSASNIIIFEKKETSPAFLPNNLKGANKESKKYQNFLSDSASLVKEINIDSKKVLTSTWKDFENRDIIIELDSWTIIKNKDSKLKIDTSKVGISEAKQWDKDQIIQKLRIDSENKKLSFNENNVKTFEFWEINKSLIFSKPVKITIPVNLEDWKKTEVFVKHNWDIDFWISWLSLNPDSICNLDWSVTTKEKEISPIVKNWKVEFYTCSASSFTVNSWWWLENSNDLKLIIWDCWQFQLTYNWVNNINSWSPPNSWCNNTLDSWFALRVWTLTYWNESNNWTTATSTWTQVGNTYFWTTNLTKTIWNKNYTLKLNRNYTSPNNYFIMDYEISVPSWNTGNIRLNIWVDSSVWWTNTNEVWYYDYVYKTIWVYDNNSKQSLSIKHLSGTLWNWWKIWLPEDIRYIASLWLKYNNTTSLKIPWDLWFWVSWSFPTYPWTYTWSLEWSLKPYIETNIVDLQPAIWYPDWWTMRVWVEWFLPITVINNWNVTSSWNHNIVLSYSWNLISWPSSSFSSNWWDCGAEVLETITCNKVTSILSKEREIFYIPIKPKVDTLLFKPEFKVSLNNLWDGYLTNNNNSLVLTIWFLPEIIDEDPPTITSITPLSWSISPVWIKFAYNYFDTWSQIDQTTATWTLSKWNGSSWIIQTWALTPISISSGSTIFSSNNISYWKYKFDVSIKDNKANTTTWSSIFYLDQPEFTISTWSLDIWKLNIWSNTFSQNEITITVKTVWSPFQIILNKTNLMQNSLLDEIIDWDWLKWVWYLFIWDLHNQYNQANQNNQINLWGGIIASSFWVSNMMAEYISKINTNEILINQIWSINTSWNLYTYIYYLRMWALIDTQQPTWLYKTNLSLWINLSY